MAIQPRVLLHNRTTLLRLVRDFGPLPRVELAMRSGLSTTTVTRAIDELLADGFVAEVEGAKAGRVGRPAIDVALVPAAGYVGAVQIGVGSVNLALCDLLARVVAEDAFEFTLDTPVGDVIDRIIVGLGDLLSRGSIGFERVVGVGVGVPGPVDVAHREQVLSINLGWRDVPFADRIEAALGVPATVDHNVRAMALAEARYGLGRDVSTLAFVYAKSGVGAGLMVQGEPYRGGHHGVTELGHLRVVTGGRPCACGSTGCLETVTSERYVRHRAAEVLGLELGSAGLKPLLAAADAGGTEAAAILDEVARHLAIGLASLVNLINTELIVLGGFFADAGEHLLRPLREELHVLAFPMLRDAVKLERTSFGARVGVVGAGAIALDRFLYGTAVQPAAGQPDLSNAARTGMSRTGRLNRVRGAREVEA